MIPHPDCSTTNNNTGNNNNNNPATAPANETPSANGKSVGFSTLTIREYAMILGDNVTMSGPPISISWEHDKEEMFDVDDYEAVYENTRRSHAELQMPRAHRDEMMRRSGFTRKQIQEASKQATIARNRRKRTAETQQLHKLQEVMENVVRSGKKGLRMKKGTSSSLPKQMNEGSSHLKSSLRSSRIYADPV